MTNDMHPPPEAPKSAFRSCWWKTFRSPRKGGERGEEKRKRKKKERGKRGKKGGKVPTSYTLKHWFLFLGFVPSSTVLLRYFRHPFFDSVSSLTFRFRARRCPGQLLYGSL